MIVSGAKITNNSKYVLYILGFFLAACLLGLEIVLQNHRVIAFLLGLAALVLIIKRPVFGISLIIVIIPLNQLQQLDILFFSSVVRIIGLITLTSFLAHCIIKKHSFIKTELFFPLAIFVFAYIVGLYRSDDLLSALEHVTTLIMYFMLYLLVVNLITDQKAIRTILLFLVVVASGLALFGIIQYYRGETLFPPEMGRFGVFYAEDESIIRVIGVFSNPNSFAYTYVLVIPLMIGILLTEKIRIYQGIMIGLLTICTLCLFLTFSRSSFLALGISVSIFLFQLKLRQKMKIIITFVGIFILISIFLPEILNILKYRMATIHHPDVQHRIDLVKEGIHTFFLHPLIGSGTGNAPLILGKYTGSFVRGPHNNLISVLIETGLLGFMPFVFIFINFTKKILNAITKTNNHDSKIILVAILASICGYFMNGLFHTSINYGLWWVILGLGTAYSNIFKYSHISEPR